MLTFFSWVCSFMLCKAQFTRRKEGYKRPHSLIIRVYDLMSMCTPPSFSPSVLLEPSLFYSQGRAKEDKKKENESDC
ncbi:hypothetical protein F5H01DRAFT_348445, partial [Linnemannia elongata]